MYLVKLCVQIRITQQKGSSSSTLTLVLWRHQRLLMGAGKTAYLWLLQMLKSAESVLFCRISDEEVLISRMLEKALRRSRAVDTEGLCILAGEKVHITLLIKIGIYIEGTGLTQSPLGVGNSRRHACPRSRWEHP